MSKYRTQGHLDVNHTAIMNYWRSLYKVTVADTSGQGGFVDAIVCNHARETIVVEIKTPTGKFKCSQLEFLARWRGMSAFVTNEEEAYEVIFNSDRYCLKGFEKDQLLTLATQRRKESPADDPDVLVTTVKKLLGR